MVCAAFGISTSGNNGVASITFAGTGGTNRAEVATTLIPCAIFTATEASTTSGTIAITFDGSCTGCGEALYRVIDPDSEVPAATGSDTSHASGVLNLDLNVASGGAWIGVTSSRNASTTTWSTGTETLDVDVSTGEYGSSAYGTASGTPLSLDATNADTTPGDYIGVSISFDPAIKGTASLTLPSLTIAASATEEIPGTGGVTAPTPSIAASGTHTGGSSAEGTGSVTAPALSIAASAYMQPDGAGALTVPTPSIAASGQEEIPGSAAITIPTPSLAASGAQQIPGTAALTLPGLSIAGAGQEEIPGSAAITLPALSLSAAGELEIPSSAAVTIPTPSLAASASQTSDVTGAVTLASLSIAGVSVLSDDGTATITLPALSIETLFPSLVFPPEITTRNPLHRRGAAGGRPGYRWKGRA